MGARLGAALLAAHHELIVVRENAATACARFLQEYVVLATWPAFALRGFVLRRDGRQVLFLPAGPVRR